MSNAISTDTVVGAFIGCINALRQWSRNRKSVYDDLGRYNPHPHLWNKRDDSR